MNFRLLLLAAAAAPSVPREVNIPEMNRDDAIRSFQLSGKRNLYLQDRHGRWHLARLSGRCPGLKKARALAFDLGASLELSQTSAILTGAARCPIDSLTLSDPPPKRKKLKP